ncbi:hypothetical protein AMAG_05707 [Allomyces macrogynus ATCC 38327]|uniref:F-box domain-containing protein n=1 Tax=Allomyces macrogynus (strain ATCC 38327) TaxID=578462 RepID=A0A0L0SD03_ALLM3|nr:hypothetical protein AMAG_05707 [Allomyces macrogynus ATCC 38327]|eukprot:KNE60304.1 hypothetical protein AMAG_05707 [Allomyces macrogynus ATCC 38327]
MTNTNQHSQKSEDPLQLTELPYDVLFRIAKFTICDQDRVTVLRLALAAPALYVPGLHVAIQSEPQFHWQKLRMHHAKKDTLLATPKLVGRVFGVEEQLVPKNELYLDLCNEDKSDEFPKCLVANLPETVGSLRVFADFVPPRLPLAKRALTIGIPYWDAATARMVPLASTLREIHLTSGPDYVPHSADHLVHVLTRLPDSLMSLALTGYSLPGPALVALHQRLPLRLIKLQLKQCNLVRAAHVNDLPMPRSLRDLNLSRNHFDPEMPRVPHGVKALRVTIGVISANASIFAWLQLLPPSLRSLDLAGSTISVQDADVLIEHVAENVEPLQIRVNKERISLIAFERLQTRFDVVAV